MSKIVVLTDLHIDLAPRAGSPDPQARLADAVRVLNEDQADADMLVVTGDLTHRGDAEAYETLRRLLASLRMPVALMLGNHDDRGRFLQAFPDTPTDPAGFVQQTIDLADVRLILLDTLAQAAPGDPVDHRGLLCPGRLDWLQAALAGTALPAIVFLHHPPHATGFPAMDAIRLRNGDAFHDVIDRAGNVRQLVCGHIHRTISGSHRGTPFAVFKSPVGQMPLDFETMDCHVEVMDPPAYGILLTTPQGVLVHTQDF